MRSNYFILLGLFSFVTFPLNASPVFLFLKNSEADLLSATKKCVSQKADKPGLNFRPASGESDYYIASEMMIQSAQKSSLERVKSILCLNSIQLGDEEKKQLSEALDAGMEIQKEFLEIYRRWLYSFGQNNKISPLDEKEINKFFEAKHDLYMLLHGKTQRWIFRSIRAEDEEKITKDFYYLYVSIAKLHYEFYNSISDDYRNAIIEKIK
ncbi:MAG: hypothetical protein IT569_03230 [Leptospiraceae bacterium]|nr:hypothetical protein [Leptospiraceae bacterium]